MREPGVLHRRLNKWLIEYSISKILSQKSKVYNTLWKVILGVCFCKLNICFELQQDVLLLLSCWPWRIVKSNCEPQDLSEYNYDEYNCSNYMKLAEVSYIAYQAMRSLCSWQKVQKKRINSAILINYIKTLEQNHILLGKQWGNVGTTQWHASFDTTSIFFFYFSMTRAVRTVSEYNKKAYPRLRMGECYLSGI